jgi:CBS domain-containing protein
MNIESRHSALAGAGHRNTSLSPAVASCFVTSFSGIAEKSRLEFASFNLDTEGMLDNTDGIWRFTEIKLRPVVTVLKEEDRDRAIRLMEKTEKSCLVARSLQFKATLFPAVKVREELSVSTIPLSDSRRRDDRQSLTAPAARLQ